LYEVQTFPIAVDEQPNHITQVRDLPKYFVATENLQFYVLPKDVDSSDKSHILNMARSREPFRFFANLLSCVSALFKNNRQLIQDLCQFRLFKESLMPSVNFLTNTQILLWNVTNATLTCGKQRTTRQIPKCDMYTHEIGCDCSLTIWNKMGEIEMSY